MNWRDHVKKNTITAAEAASLVESGNRVAVGHAAGAPDILTRAMVDRAEELRDVEITHMVALDECLYCRPEHAKSFRFNSTFMSRPTVDALAEGRADYTPIFFSQIPMLMREPSFPIDVAMIMVTPPDDQGRVSLGVSVDYTLEIAKSAKMTIAQVNKHMPYIVGGALLDVSVIDRFVFHDSPLPELPPTAFGDTERAIGEQIANLIPDGACLQLGIGSIPDAVLAALDSKRNLGVHSEMISDGAMRLVEKGVINCSQKTIHQGKIVISFAMGTSHFYSWLDRNPMIESYPVDYVDDARVIGRHDNLVAINSAMSVDLLGQVAAESLGTRQFSAVGGQVDFVRGARFSQGGFSIIAMPATAASGKISRICGVFPPGQAITTTRNDVDYIVTEYGTAYLWGKTTNQRAAALIHIAAPEFREELAREARDIYGFRVLV